MGTMFWNTIRHELRVSADVFATAKMDIQEDDDRVEVDIFGSSRSNLVVIGTTSQCDIVSIYHQHFLLINHRETHGVKQQSNRES
jgi:hypothetical protein